MRFLTNFWELLILKYLSEICCAFEYLHSFQIVHCDLCASNVLIDRNKRAKLSDFGLAISLRNNNYVRTSKYHYPTKIRVKWSAPESLGGKNFSLKSDVWSFSIFLWEIFSFGRTPYPRISVEEIEEFLLSGNRMSPPEGSPIEIVEIMSMCWKLRPDDRPTFTYLKNIFSTQIIID